MNSLQCIASGDPEPHDREKDPIILGPDAGNSKRKRDPTVRGSCPEKEAWKEVKKAACSAVLMDLSEKFTTVSKTWAVAPNKELEPPSLGLSTPNLYYFDHYLHWHMWQHVAGADSKRA